MKGKSLTINGLSSILYFALFEILNLIFFSNPENSLREKGRKNKIKMILKKKMKKKGFFSCQKE